MLLEMKKFGVDAHKGSRPYGGLPYEKHLNDVFNVMITFSVTDEVLLGMAWIHDTIEDTQVVYEDVKNEFGTEVADLAYLVTDKRGRNRKERHEKTYPELAKSHKARIVKLADRIANITMSLHDNQEKFLMYEKEYPYFRETLMAEMDKEDEFHVIELNMWLHLDRLIDLGPFIEY